MFYAKQFLLLAWAACSAAQIAKRNVSNPQPSNFQLSASSQCCQVTDEADQLMECLNSAIAGTRESVLGTLNSVYGPTLSVGLVTPLPARTLEAAFGLGIIQAYVEGNTGYFLDIFESKGTASVAWEKIEYLRNALDDVTGWARKANFLVWVDSDIVIVDMGMKVEGIFSKYKKASMIISEGVHDTKIATSFFMLRNNARTLEFLDDWLRQGRGLEMSFEDAVAFSKLVDGDEEEYESIIKIIPADSLNTVYPASNNFKPHNQVLNLVEEHELFRRRVFSEAFHEICRADASHRAGVDPIEILPHQLNLNVQNLSSMGMSVYAKMFDEEMAQYSIYSAEGLNNATSTGDLAFNLRNIARLLDANDKAEFAQGLRERAFKEMFLNFKKRRHLNSDEKEATGENFPDWLEFMDHVTLVGSEYAQKIVDSDERRIAMKVMLELANELDSLDSTRLSVQERLMNIHMDMGMIAGRSNENEESTKHFVEAVRIGRILLTQKYITDVAIFFPLSFTGDAFMKQARYKEALVMYQYALDIGKKTLAAGDVMLPTMKLQFGIANYYDQRYRTAVTSIEDGLKYFSAMEEEMDEDTFAVVEQAVAVLDAARKAKYDPKVFDDNLRNEF
jgi:tetratricopeptide (TPR) repeat protein